MEMYFKTIKQVKKALEQNKKLFYGRILITGFEKNKIKTSTKDIFFKPWLPAIRTKPYEIC